MLLPSTAFGGEEGPDKFDPNIRYRGSLQNYLIDTGDEVILVDTGLPKEFPAQVMDENAQIYLGNPITDYVSAFQALGYRPEQVTKILVTHKHADHTGALAAFPNATIYASAVEAEADELSYLPNVKKVEFTDGPWHIFEKTQTIAEGIHYIKEHGSGEIHSLQEWHSMIK